MPMAAPHVTVLVPTYNHGAFIAETLESVLAQDYPSFNVVVGDDGSTDETVEIARGFEARHPKRVRLIASDTNSGIPANYNRLLGATRGCYCAWLGGDDMMLPGKLRRQVALMEDRPDAVMSAHDAEVFDSDTGRVLGRFSEVYNGRRGVRAGGVELLFQPAHYWLPSSIMVRLDAVRGRRYDERLRFSNEWIFDIETLLRGPCVTLDDVLARYRRHRGNVTASAELGSEGLEENLIVMALAQARYPELTSLVRLRRTGLLVSQALGLRARDRRRALRYARAALLDGGPIRVGRVLAAYAAVAGGRRLLGVPAPT